MITWTPIAQLPDELKDGREVLLWSDDPRIKGAIQVDWVGTGWAEVMEGRLLDDIDFTHFAEITPP